VDEFEERNEKMVQAMAEDSDLTRLARAWFERAAQFEYSYHFTWLGRPIIQFPQDIVAIQEIVWSVKPVLIVETGIARGGSLVFYASLLELLGGAGRVVGVDVEIRPENRRAIEAHPLARRIKMIEGSSVDPVVVDAVRREAAGSVPVMVVLDSLHTHAHVLRELMLYAPLVTKGSYLVVLDTVIEDMPPAFSGSRPWRPGDNPKTAVAEFLRSSDRFEVDRSIDAKLLITVAPGGYLRCVKD
jgi:cephalosporin hydroxylase